MASEAHLRRLLRQIRRGRWRWAPNTVKWTGERAERELLSAAARGDRMALRVLAAPVPDRLFTSLWLRLLHDHDCSRQVYAHLDRKGYGSLGRLDRNTRSAGDLAQLVRLPAEDLLTDRMRNVVAVAAAFGNHPLAAIAQDKILRAADPTTEADLRAVDELTPYGDDPCLQVLRACVDYRRRTD